MTDLRLGSLVMEDSGSGSPVVMLHGLGGSSNSFQTLMGAVDGYRVLRPDLPGAGRSALRPGLTGLTGLARVLHDLLRAAGIGRAHFVGHSMGTLIAQHLAAGTPEAVASLTLFGPILAPPAAARVALKERATAARVEGMTAIADAVASASVAPEAPVAAAFVRESVMRQPPRGYAAHCEALSTAEAADHSRIVCPSLLVAGESDPVAPVAMVRELGRRIAGARIEILPGVAHWMMVESPQRCGELLRGHLEDIALR